MDDFIREIEVAVEHGLWQLALAGTLALPDICAAAQSENGKTTGSKYKNWVRDYLCQEYPKLDPDELYQMRCSSLHQGTSSAIKYKRIIFVAPNPSVRIHNGVVDDALILDMPMFSGDVISAVRSWQGKVSGTKNYENNIDLVMRWHRGGFGQYISGGDVLT